MAVYKLTPVYKEYIWGGTKLIKKWKKGKGLNSLAESWELSTHKDGVCLVENRPLSEILNKEDIGKDIKEAKLPVLVKLIDAGEKLSVQVHPTKEYAENHNAEAKTEFWYILGAEEGAGIYVGLKEDYTKEQIKESIENKTLLEHMNFFTVKPNEAYLIEGGIFHAIGKGVTLLEVQQNSNTTYRVYDYDRLDKNGKARELHIDDALGTAETKKYIPKMNFGEINTPYFATRPLKVRGYYSIQADESSFVSLFVVRGAGKIGKHTVKRGDTLFIPAKEGAKILGFMKVIAITL